MLLTWELRNHKKILTYENGPWYVSPLYLNELTNHVTRGESGEKLPAPTEGSAPSLGESREGAGVLRRLT